MCLHGRLTLVLFPVVLAALTPDLTQDQLSEFDIDGKYSPSWRTVGSFDVSKQVVFAVVAL
jgi:hypothetical protein